MQHYAEDESFISPSQAKFNDKTASSRRRFDRGNIPSSHVAPIPPVTDHCNMPTSEGDPCATSVSEGEHVSTSTSTSVLERETTQYVSESESDGSIAQIITR